MARKSGILGVAAVACLAGGAPKVFTMSMIQDGKELPMVEVSYTRAK